MRAEGTGRHYALHCVVNELARRGILRSASIETLDLSLYPGPAQEKLFLQDLYAALQSDAEVLAFDHYEGCAANYLNMLATLSMDGTLGTGQPVCAAAGHPGGCGHRPGPRRYRGTAGGRQVFRLLLP